MPLKALFFDIDGTLVDSNEFHVMAWQEAFKDHGYQIARPEIRSQIGKGADQLIPALIPGSEARTQAAMATRHGEIFTACYINQVKAFPRATDLLEMLHAKGKKIILASSAARDEVEYYSKLLKIEKLLAGTISKDDVKNSKPARDIFAAALAQVFPIDASQTLAIGDTPYDVESALHSQIKTVALRSGGFSEEILANAGAPFIYASVKELFDNFASSPFKD